MDAIKGFFGYYRFLSNFWYVPHGITYAGHTFTSVEAAYQASKSVDPEVICHFVSMTPREAKNLGRRISIRDDWEDMKVDIMLGLLRQKFVPGSDLALCLIKTGDALLEETNTWGDTIWGVYKGKGSNFLGKLLMQVREELQKGEK